MERRRSEHEFERDVQNSPFEKYTYIREKGGEKFFGVRIFSHILFF